jgi:hypothetical protein
MSTFRRLVNEGLLTGDEKCNLRGHSTPDGCWGLHNNELASSHLFCVEFQAAIEDLPKLIIDAFINKHGKIPDVLEFNNITKEVIENMKVAVNQGQRHLE